MLYNFFVGGNYSKLPEFPTHCGYRNYLLPSIIRKARRFFPKDCTQEILDEVLPLLNPHDTVYARAVATLVLFLPNDQPELWIDTVLEELSRRQLCSSEKNAWFQLLARSTKHNIGKINFNGKMQSLFQIFFKSCGLSVAGQSDPCKAQWTSSLKHCIKGSAKKSYRAVGEFAKLVVYTISSTSNTVDLLVRFLNSVRSYLYPKNKGKHSSAVFVFISRLCKYLIARVARERNGELEVPKKRLDFKCNY